jgi:hypothetical protein
MNPTPLKQYYDEGMVAYDEGKKLWECPYVRGDSPVVAFTTWLAGWMRAKQLAEASKAAINPEE